MSNPDKTIRLDTEELVRLIMSAHGIHEGFFVLVPELMFNLGPHSVMDQNSGVARDHAGISMITTAYRLQRVNDHERGSFDAATINPKKTRSTKPRATSKDPK